jgi:thiamine-monophosphate kinase
MGLQTAQEESGIDLVGGDTCATLGPLTITVTAIGMLPQGESVLRRGAMGGDRLYVSGTIGDAALGLKLLRAPWLEVEWGLSPDEGAFLVDRYRCPSARTALALPLRRYRQALHGLGRERDDRGGARPALVPGRQGGRQEA